MKHFCFFVFVAFLNHISLARDNFPIEDSFKEAVFEIDDFDNQVRQDVFELHVDVDNSKIFSHSKESLPSAKALSATNKVVLPKPLFITTGSQRKINIEVLDNETFSDILVAVQCLYETTKRYRQDGLMFQQNQIAGKNANETNPNISPACRDLIKRKVKIVDFVHGTHGFGYQQEGGIVAMVAYKIVTKNDKPQIRIFVIEEGSQGENFQFLGGVGGASWMTNFNAAKIKVNAGSLEISNRYLIKPDQQLLFHEGFYNKVISSKISLQTILISLFDSLKIKSSLSFEKASGIDLKARIDQRNSCEVKLYIVGHSQGGGLVQIAAPYLTSFVGKYIYGEAFDNAVFNMAHAICLSPARAIGDKNTLTVVEKVMGPDNILGYCSYADPVPCVPLGTNIGYDPAKKVGMKIMQSIAKAISWILPEPWSSFLKTISSVENFYETLNVWAYEDPFPLVENYCKISMIAINEYINCLGNPECLPVECLQETKINEKKLRENNIKNAQKLLSNLQKTYKKVNNIKKNFLAVQEAYFKAHTHNVVKSNFYAKVAIINLLKVLKDIKPGTLVGAQHFGTYSCLKFKPWGKEKTYVSLECLFKSDLLKKDVQAAMDLGIEYHKRKDTIRQKK